MTTSTGMFFLKPHEPAVLHSQFPGGNYWIHFRYNATFHTGKWVHTTADRPLIMEFAADGGLLPTHSVGLSVTGLIPSGKLGLNYLLEYGSSAATRQTVESSHAKRRTGKGAEEGHSLFLAEIGISQL